MAVEFRPQNRELEVKLEEHHGMHPILARSLSARNADMPTETFLRSEPSLSKLNGLQRADALGSFLDTLADIGKKNGSILFYGDYDVDGLLATYILLCVSRYLGINASYFLPSRFNEGYGLNARVVKQVADKGFQLLFALDCGTSNFEEVELARKLGLSVLILDHHRPILEGFFNKLEGANIINPHLEDGLSPLCSTALAFLFAKHWLEFSGKSCEFLLENFLELPLLAIIADVVPIVGDNFLLSHFGWRKIAGTKNLGLRTLFQMLGLSELGVFTSRDIAFSIVPTLNAAGRMAHARLALELLLAKGEAEAQRIAQSIIKLNQARRELQERLFQEASRQALDYADCPIIVLYDPNWNQGLTGIVSARIAESFGKPALIFSDASAEEGQAVFSGRGIEGVDLLATLSPLKQLFTKLGGHSQAVGGSMPKSSINDLRSLAKSLSLVEAPTTTKPHLADASCTVSELMSLGPDELARVYPFGEGYPPPRLLLSPAILKRKSLAGYDETHLLLSVQDESGGAELKLVGFRRSHLEPSLKVDTLCDFLIEIELDNFRGKTSLMFRLLDAFPRS